MMKVMAYQRLIPSAAVSITDKQISSSFAFQTIMEQFNPCLRNFVAMGKNYEKALSSKYGTIFSHSVLI